MVTKHPGHAGVLGQEEAVRKKGRARRPEDEPADSVTCFHLEILLSLSNLKNVQKP